MKCTNLTFIQKNYYTLRLTIDRPDLSSERAPHRDQKKQLSDRNLQVGGNNVWSQAQSDSTPRHIDLLTVIRNVTLLYKPFFVIPFYLQSVLVHSENCVKDVYSGM
jgi:hypothetical protein